jgi:D-glycero-alpha-D-manno-heptose 1-phosphate guanylyltransferase
MFIMKQQPIKPILVLAGGFGSRLRSVVSDVPKPLAPVNGKPFLIRLIENLIYQGAQEFVLLLHYKAELIKDIIYEFIKKNNTLKVKINCIVEDIPLGTGGSIMNAITEMNITNSFLVINADTWLGDGLLQLSLSSANTIVVVKVKDCTRYGTLVLKGDKIKKFLEKNSCRGESLINAGLYHLNPAVFSKFVKNDYISLENDVFPSLVDKGLLFAIKVQADFIDIGVPQDYFKFCNWIEAGKLDAL